MRRRALLLLLPAAGLPAGFPFDQLDGATQTFPAQVSCALPAGPQQARHRHGLFHGWLTGITCGSALVALGRLAPVHELFLGQTRLSVFTALIALSANLAVTWRVTSGRVLMMVGQR